MPRSRLVLPAAAVAVLFATPVWAQRAPLPTSIGPTVDTVRIPCSGEGVRQSQLPDGLRLARAPDDERMGLAARDGYRFVRRDANRVVLVRMSDLVGGRAGGRGPIPAGGGGPKVEVSCSCWEGETSNCRITVNGRSVHCYGSCIGPDGEPSGACEARVTVESAGR